MLPFRGVNDWRELNHRGMNFIPVRDLRNAGETSFAAWHLIFGQESPGAAL
jgi:hypothetical protein